MLLICPDQIVSPPSRAQLMQASMAELTPSDGFSRSTPTRSHTLTPGCLLQYLISRMRNVVLACVLLLQIALGDAARRPSAAFLPGSLRPTPNKGKAGQTVA